LEILLIHPRDAGYRYRGLLRHQPSYAPLTLTTLAALVPPELEADIRIIDEGVERPDLNGLSPDVVGITCITSSAHRSYKLAKEFRQRGSLVVLGGVHPTLNPDEAAEHADVVVRGFADQTWPGLLLDHRAGRQPDPILEDVPRRQFSSPTPRRDLLRRGRYIPLPTTIATRGCRNPCRFCVVPPLYGREASTRPVEEVVEEIRAMGARQVVLLDSNFITDRDYALSLLEALVPLGIRWGSSATLDVVNDKEMFSLFVRSGCNGLFVGLESMAQESMDGCGKRFNQVSRYLEDLGALRAAGISTMCSFMFGFDQDGADIFSRTLDFVDRARPEMLQFGVVTPFPGTGLFSDLEEEGRILTRDWRLYDTQHVVYQPARMSCVELQDGLHQTWRRSASARRLIDRTRHSALGKIHATRAALAFRRMAGRCAAESRYCSVAEPAAAAGNG
jgi:radical SAM superfamily enzyme YgiQ (UPF0313 family)